MLNAPMTRALAPLLAVVLLAAACGGQRPCAACAAVPPASPDAVMSDVAAFTRPLERVFKARPGPHRLLVLSGGGGSGAWGAGVLKSWSERGDRPVFDVVTGVSTGAMIGTFAFLGSKYDGRLEQAYTTMTPDSVYSTYFLPWALLFESSLRDTTPLARMVSEYFTDEVIDEVGRVAREEHRVFWVGTTDMDTGDFKTWDMTAIAASKAPGRHDLYRRILLASTALPALFPPVTIDRTLYADGGLREQIFGMRLATAVVAAYKTISPPPGKKSVVYAIVNGQLVVPNLCVRERLYPIGLRTINVALIEGMLGSLYRLRVLMPDPPWTLLLSHIPSGMFLDPAVDSFDNAQMRAIYAEARRWGTTLSWQPFPDDIPLSPLPCVGP